MAISWTGFDAKFKARMTEAKRRLRRLISRTPELEHVSIVDRSGKFGPEVEVKAEVDDEVISVTRHGGTRTHALHTSIDDLSRTLARREHPALRG